MGDTFFNQSFPFVDIDSGGTVEGIVAAGRAVLAQVDAETRIIPGHGPIAAPSDLETYLRMIEETRPPSLRGSKRVTALRSYRRRARATNGLRGAMVSFPPSAGSPRCTAT